MDTKTKVGTTFVVTAAVAGVGLGVVGCTLDRFVKVEVPEPMQSALGIEDHVTLRDAPHTRESFLLSTKQTLESFDSNISDALIVYDMIAAGANMGIDATKGPLGGLPYGGMLVSGLGMAGAYFLKRPGDKAPAEHAAEVDKSYDAGVKDASEKFKDLLEKAGVRVAEKVAVKIEDKAAMAIADAIVSKATGGGA